MKEILKQLKQLKVIDKYRITKTSWLYMIRVMINGLETTISLDSERKAYELEEEILELKERIENKNEYNN